MCDTYTGVNENVRRVRRTIETRMFCCFSVVLQLVTVTQTATNVNNIKKINFFYYFFFFTASRFEAEVILSASKRRKSRGNVELKNIDDCVWPDGC